MNNLLSFFDSIKSIIIKQDKKNVSPVSNQQAPQRPQSQQVVFKRRDILPLTSLFSRKNIRDDSRLSIQKECIIIPEFFYESTVAMCEAQRETRGVFLVSKNQHLPEGWVIVEAMISIGYGSAGGVYPEDKKFEAMNKLLSRYSNEIKGIDFHTHTVATGSSWYETFSDLNSANDDVQSLMNNINRNGTYKHVLFTPTSVLTFGKKKPIIVVKDFDRMVNPSTIQMVWQDRFNSFIK
jgi:hypothetical protein